MKNDWARWDKNVDYKKSKQIEIIFVNTQNQICLKVESTDKIDWHRTEDAILGWRPAPERNIVKRKSNYPILVRYWNYHSGKFWPTHIAPPNTKLPGYLKVTMALIDGKMDVHYEMHSKNHIL